MTLTENTTTITGKKCLVTTNAWFYAPDGRQYRAAWGTIKAAVNAEQALGIKVNRQSADWYLQIGNLTIAGCQIHYVVETPHCVFGPANDWSAGGDAGIKEYSRPSGVYNADGAVEMVLKEQANITLINDSAVDLVAEQANEPKYKKIEGVDHDPYYEPVELQPEPVLETVLRSDFDFLLHDKQRAVKLIEEAYELLAEGKIFKAKELLEKRVNNPVFIGK